MAKARSGILGPFSGKIGPIVGSSWKNIAYIRSVPKSDGTKKVPSAAQLAQQQKFKFMTQWLEPFYPYVTVGFSNLAKDKTEINLAFTENYRKALIGNYPDFEIDYEMVCLSRGPLAPLFPDVVTLTGVQQISLEWDDRNNGGTTNDQLMLVVYSPALKIADGFVGMAKRSDGHVSFKFNPKLIGQSLEVYVSMVSLNRKKISNSIYLGRMEPL
ncbi:MAG: hypothetical protein EOO42_00915 [Flavobacteriales bacterium]|nr:MAG: hypothetical protein EOO42_00915 [Flavobacteriales bacterium]